MIASRSLRLAGLASSTLLLALVGLGGQACSSPAVEDEPEGSAAAATGVAGPDVDSAYSAIKDDVGYVCTGGVAKKYTIHDDAPITVGPDRDFTKPSGPGKKFAAATVLAGMRRLRRYYNTVPYKVNAANPVAVTAEGAHGNPASTALASCSPTFNGPFDQCSGGYPFNLTDDGSTGGNMGAMPAFWSDVQAHIYIMAPHERHGCWTYTFYAGLKGGACKTPIAAGVTEPDIRQTARDFCTGQVAFAGGCGNFTQALAGVPAQLSAYNLLWVNPKTSTFVPLPETTRVPPPHTDGTTLADVPKTVGAKFAKEQRDAGNVNIWDYVMMGQYYAFDLEQQQAVLNAYYADNKTWSGDKAPFNPCDATECSKWRAPRNGEAGGTQCRTDKPASPVAQDPWQ